MYISDGWNQTTTETNAHIGAWKCNFCQERLQGLGIDIAPHPTLAPHPNVSPHQKKIICAQHSFHVHPLSQISFSFPLSCRSQTSLVEELLLENINEKLKNFACAIKSLGPQPTSNLVSVPASRPFKKLWYTNLRRTGKRAHREVTLSKTTLLDT